MGSSRVSQIMSGPARHERLQQKTTVRGKLNQQMSHGKTASGSLTRRITKQGIKLWCIGHGEAAAINEKETMTTPAGRTSTRILFMQLISDRALQSGKELHR